MGLGWTALCLLALLLWLKIKPPRGKPKRKSAVGNIYKTTDGYLGGNKNNKKRRSVIAIAQRASDGAIAVAKVHGKKGKDTTNKSKYIQNLELSPKKHPALKEPSIVEKRAIFGLKEGKSYKPIQIRDLEDTGDKLKGKELKAVQDGIQNDTENHRKTYENTKKKWENGFNE